MDLHTLEEHKARDRFNRQQDRIVLSAGYGDTEGALRITKEHLGVLEAAITTKLDAPCDARSLALGFEVQLRALGDPSLIACCILQGVLHSIGREDVIQNTITLLGSILEGELWAHGFTKDNPKVSASIEKQVRARYGSVEKRNSKARALAARHGYTQKRWSRELKAHAGQWLLDALLTALPHVFAAEQEGQDATRIVLTAEAENAAIEMVEDLIKQRPVFLPMKASPLPWTAYHLGGPRDQLESYARPLLRTRHKATAAECRASIKAGQAQPTLDAVNTMQGVPWKINTRILDVIVECVAKGITVEGLPGDNLKRPPKPLDEDKGTQDLWRLQYSRVRKHNLALVSDRLLLAEDLETAERMRDWEAFYTPMSLDWRGRVYGMTSFNFQREDRVRALFQFAEGEPIGTDGLWWLKVHIANCGDFDKVSKRPLEERVAWVDENISAIQNVAEQPLTYTAWWTKADKPFLFLAACLELAAALATGLTYVTHLPVSFDGSCSGLQHLCAMTRAPEGSLVNLTPASEPQDVYATVAKRVLERVTADSVAEPDEGKEWVPIVAKLALAYGIDRKVTKRNVMTYSYSSKKFGMASQQQEDLMEPLHEEVLTGKRGDHPFEVYAQEKIKGSGSVAGRYLAGHVYEAIEEIISLPADAMAFLQKLAKALAHEGKPLRWTTPCGLPWSNRYHVANVRNLNLYLHDRRIRMKLSVGDKPGIDKEKAAAGVAPNFVHALDAAHLMLVANAAAKEGITSIATVHDSFGCLASRARRFNAIIREEFVEMYETHDVLAEVLAQAKHDLTPHNWQRLPEVPHQGTLELKGVLNADYAFA